MSVTFRNVDAHPSDPVATWPYEALVTAIDRGLVPDWRPIFTEIRRSPWGPTARRVERYLSYRESDGVSTLFRLAVDRARSDAETAEREHVARCVRAAITRSGLTADAFARLVGTSPSRLSTYVNGRVVPSATLMARIEAAADHQAATTPSRGAGSDLVAPSSWCHVRRSDPTGLRSSAHSLQQPVDRGRRQRGGIEEHDASGS